MNTVFKSAGDSGAVISSTAPTSTSISTTGADSGTVIPLRPVRDGAVTISELIDQYMLAYAGRDTTRAQRLRWWQVQLGSRRLVDLDDDDVHFALQELAARHGRYACGKDADGAIIFKAKSKPLSAATVNRYGAALGALCTWAIKNRIAPKGWQNPCSGIERKAEHNERVRFLSDKELKALLAACKRSPWKKLYAFVLLALTTGARRGELESLRWQDVDLDNAHATLPNLTKNNDRRVLPLLPHVIEELRRHVVKPDLSHQLLFASRKRPDVAFNHVTSWHNALKQAKVGDFRFHDLRHTAASYLAMKGATLLEIADVLGHRNLSVTRRYSHLTTTHKANLVGRVLGDIR